MNSDVEFAGLSHVYNVNCLEFLIILPPVPKVNKLSVHIFWKEKGGFTTYGSIKKKFQLKRNVI